MDPHKGREGIIVGSGETVLRGEAIVDGDPDGLRLGGHAATEGVKGSGMGRTRAKATAMEVKDKGDLLPTNNPYNISCRRRRRRRRRRGRFG